MSAVQPALALPPASRWRPAGGALLLVLAALLLLYRETAWAMVQIWWRSDTFAHGFLVLPISLWLVWRKRSALAALQPQAEPLWLLPLALAGLLWLVGELALVNALAQMALVAMCVLAVPTLLGRAVAGSVLFPLGFLFFAVPLGEFLLPLLVQWTADVTIFAVRHSGIPVWREGNSFVIPSGRWSVVEACSGVRYLIASFMVGTLFAYLSYRSYAKRLLFVAASLVVPVLANWVRAYLIVMLGHLSNNRIATGVDHVLYGWLFFGLVIALMFMLGARWADPPVDASSAAVAAPTRALAVPQGGAVMLIGVAALGLVLLAALPQLAGWRLEQSAGSLPDSAASAALPPPRLAPAWPVAEGQVPAFKPAYRPPPAEWQGVYGPPGRQVGLYVALYRQQQRGYALVSSDNALLPSLDAPWLPIAQGRLAVRVPGQTLTLQRSVLRSTTSAGGLEPAGLQVLQLFWVHGHVTRSPLVAKLFGALARLSGQRDDAALLLAYAPSGAAGEGDAALAAFWSDNYALLTDWLLRNSGAHENVLKGFP